MHYFRVPLAPQSISVHQIFSYTYQSVMNCFAFFIIAPLSLWSHIPDLTEAWDLKDMDAEEYIDYLDISTGFRPEVRIPDSSQDFADSVTQEYYYHKDESSPLLRIYSRRSTPTEFFTSLSEGDTMYKLTDGQCTVIYWFRFSRYAEKTVDRMAFKDCAN